MPIMTDDNINSNSSMDRKFRFGGVFENPVVSKFQRGIMDGGRVGFLKKCLAKYSYSSVVDIGCGLGEYCAVNKGFFCGIDNSKKRVAFAAKMHGKHSFAVADAKELPFNDNTFDVVMLIDTSHHLSDDEFKVVLDSMKRIGKKYIVISDPVLFDGQGAVSRFFYDLDRGGKFRSIGQMRKFFETNPDMLLLETKTYRTFPGLYVHAAFVLEKTKGC